MRTKILKNCLLLFVAAGYATNSNPYAWAAARASEESSGKDAVFCLSVPAAISPAVESDRRISLRKLPTTMCPSGTGVVESVSPMACYHSSNIGLAGRAESHSLFSLYCLLTV